MFMPKFQELRLEANLSVNRLSRLSDVDFRTAHRADKGEPVQQLKAFALVRALSEALGRTITVEDVDDLKLS